MASRRELERRVAEQEAELQRLREQISGWIPPYLREGATGPLTSRGELRNQTRVATLVRTFDRLKLTG
jgi:uncharacterized protein YPO0396